MAPAGGTRTPPLGPPPAPSRSRSVPVLPDGLSGGAATVRSTSARPGPGDDLVEEFGARPVSRRPTRTRLGRGAGAGLARPAQAATPGRRLPGVGPGPGAAPRGDAPRWWSDVGAPRPALAAPPRHARRRGRWRRTRARASRLARAGPGREALTAAAAPAVVDRYRPDAVVVDHRDAAARMGTHRGDERVLDPVVSLSVGDRRAVRLGGHRAAERTARRHRVGPVASWSWVGRPPPPTPRCREPSPAPPTPTAAREVGASTTPRVTGLPWQRAHDQNPRDEREHDTDAGHTHPTGPHQGRAGGRTR